MAELLEHRHGSLVHSHPHQGRHRHLPYALPLSAPVEAGPEEHVHTHDHADHHQGHSHGLVDESIKRSREGIRAVSLSLVVLGLAAVAQTVIFLASASIALLADLIHNYGDALTALPLGVAF